MTASIASRPAGHVLVARLDNDGDVLLAGPAVRAAAAGAERVTLWCGPRGRRGADLLPGVDEVVEAPVSWIDPDPQPITREATLALVERLEALRIDEAAVLTSFHQSPLPTALVLRMAGVERIAAVSDDYPGGLIDVRHRIAEDVHEVERALSTVATLGHRLPHGDDGRLAVRRTGRRGLAGPPGYVVVHPGASVPARAWAPERWAATVTALAADGWRVVVTGGPNERDLAARVAGTPRPGISDLAGRTSLADLAEVCADAAAVLVGNTGPAHLAAAVGTPVVSLFAATVPAARWRPWGVPSVLLGDHAVACAGCRAASCPIPGQPCLDVDPGEVVAALRRLVADRDATLPPSVRPGALPALPRRRTADAGGERTRGGGAA